MGLPAHLAPAAHDLELVTDTDGAHVEFGGCDHDDAVGVVARH